MMNKQPDFSLQQIPSNIFTLKNFSKWRYVGNELEVALFNGLLEYHIEVNKVDNFLKQLLSQQNIGQKVKTIIQNTEKKKMKRMETFLTEMQTQENYFISIKEIMKNFFSLKSVKDQQAKEKLLADTFQIIIIINDKSQRISEYKNNPKAPSLIFYCLEQKYYFTCSLYNNNCQLCGQLIRIEQLKCSHYMCFDCLSKQFQKPNISTISCNQCHCKIDKNYYLNLQQPKNVGIKMKDENNKSEEKQLQNHQIRNNNSNSNLISSQQQQQNQLYEQKSNNFQNNQKHSEQQEQKMQLENNEKQLSQNQQIEKDKKKQVSQVQEKNIKIIQEIIQKPDVYCNCCKQILQGQNEISANICQNCYEKQQNESQFLLNSNGDQKCQQNTESKGQQSKIQELKTNEQQNTCNKCKSTKGQKMFQNNCGHIFCTPCLEQIAQHSNLRCPVCQKKMKEEKVESFYFLFQSELLEKLENEELKSNQQLMKKQENNLIAIDKQQQAQNYKQQRPSSCSFCQSPFSEYNIQQQLDYCENKTHTLGVCCIIFPLDCPQCQISSLVISKSSLSFSLQHEVYYDLKQKIHQS